MRRDQRRREDLLRQVFDTTRPCKGHMRPAVPSMSYQVP